MQLLDRLQPALSLTLAPAPGHRVAPVRERWCGRQLGFQPHKNGLGAVQQTFELGSVGHGQVYFAKTQTLAKA